MVDYEDIPPNEHPQPDLIPLYKGTRIYFYFEALWVLVWIAQMFTFIFGITSGGGEYVGINFNMIFHFGTPIATQSFTQQWRNANSVLGWQFWIFFMGLFGDLNVLLQLTSGHVTQSVGWAWGWALGLSIYAFLLSCVAFWRFVYWFCFSKAPSIPDEAALVAFKETRKRKKPHNSLLYGL